MMQLQFQAGADEWVQALCVGHSAQVKILGLKPVGKWHDFAHFFDISMKDSYPAELRRWLDSDPSVLSTELTDLSRQRVMGVVVANHCKACASIIRSDLAVFVSSAETEDGCLVGYKLFLGDEGVPTLLNRLSKDGVNYRVKGIGPFSPGVGLTQRQLGILKSALEMGFYDFPRRITLTVLAEKLGIKPSTLSEILRAAEKNVVGSFLTEAEVER